jgi:ubiquinone/menaquinone biosynthesis C-methylase UbiE
VGEQEIEYRGLIAEYWDLLRDDTSKWSSRPFFLEVIRQSGEPALDVACGTGRLLLDCLGEGIDIDGVDIAPAMIDICRQKAAALGFQPYLAVQVMEELDLPRKYQTIIVPSSSFLQLTGIGDMRRALKRFLQHLEPGGTLSMSLRVLDPDPAEALALLEQTGFVYVRGVHDFTDQPLRGDDRSFVVFGRKS